MTNSETIHDNNENPDDSEWESKIAEYDMLKRVFLARSERFWKIPTNRRRYEAQIAKDRLANCTGELVEAVVADERYEPEETFQALMGVMSMCDKDVVHGLNEIIGNDVLIESSIEFQVMDDIEQIQTLAGGLMVMLQQGINEDFNVFCGDNHFQRFDDVKKIGKQLVDVGKIATGVTLGIVASEKLRKRL